MSSLPERYTPRRVVTAVRAGKAVVVSDGPTPNAHHYEAIPGMMTSVVHLTAGDLSTVPTETAPPNGKLVPGPGEVSLVIVTFPPDSVMMSPSFDPGAAVAEQYAFAADFADRFEPDNPGKHQTDSIDYDVVLDGEIWLELDDETTHLTQGDVVVQGAARHAWRNKGEQSATMCFVLIGAASP